MERKGYSACFFHGYIPVGMVISMRVERLTLVSFIVLDISCYVLNYAERRRNMTQGQWFVNNLLYSEEIPCIDTLKKKLKNNDTKFVAKLYYFAQCVPGSDIELS
jgi:hypothetical protein